MAVTGPTTRRGKEKRVSVALSRDDVAQLADAARREGVSMSEFVRASALGRAARPTGHDAILSFSGRRGFRGMGENVTTARSPIRLIIRRPEGQAVVESY